MSTYYKAYGTETDWQDKAEKAVYAAAIRKTISMRGRTTALQFPNPDNENEFLEVELSTLSDEDITPENGFYLFSHCPPFYGKIQKYKGRISKMLSFETDGEGQEWATAKVKWTSKSCLCQAVAESLFTEQERTALNATQRDDGRYVFPALPFDFSDCFNAYDWVSDVIEYEA